MNSASPLSCDLLALGAAAMPTEDLIHILLDGYVDDDEARRAARALRLSTSARLEALRELAPGPQLLAALELGRRALLWPPPRGHRITGPSDIAAIATPRCADDEEVLLAFALDERLQVARLVEVARGRPDRVEARAADVLGPVLAAGCRRVVLAHNHLSGDPTPSAEDERGTLRLFEGARELGVRLLDHVVLGEEGHVSLLRAGVLPGGDSRYR